MGEGHALSAEEKLRLFDEYARDVVYRYELYPQPRTAYVSESVFRLSGYRADEHYADPNLGLSIVHPDDRPILRSLMDGEIPEDPITIRWLHRDGRVIWTDHRCRLVYDNGGRVVAVEGSAREVTGRLQAAGALRQSEALNQGILETVAAGVVLVNIDGSITQANPEAQRILGLGFDQLARRFVADFETATLREDGTPYPVDEYPVSRCLATGLAQPPATIGVRQPNGNVVWGVFTAAPVLEPETHELIGAIVSFLDITELRNASQALRNSEERLRHAQKMEAIGVLAGGVAHDFNNLLTAIIGFSSLVLESLPAGDPLATSVREIAGAGERAAVLTSQLLAFSRRQALQPEILNLNAIVIDLKNLLGRVIGEDIRLIVEADPAVRPILADPGQLSQVILNLAANARDAMPTGGCLTIRTANVDLVDSFGSDPDAEEEGRRQPGPYVLLEASDTGHGIDAATKARIFEPFFTTKDPGQGTGLGLSTVYGIVKQSGGDIRVQSEPGRGATFSIYLPTYPEPGVERERAYRPEDPVPRGHETILVIEDEPAVRALAINVLRGLGYQVLEASEGEEALRSSLRSESIDLLLTDLVLPGRSGREVAEEAVGLRPGLRVLYMSGYAEDVTQRHGLQLTHVPFLRKPFTGADLARKVRETLDSHVTA